MKSIQLTIKNKVGLHARPATLFVQAAQRFEAGITVSYDGKTVNAKSMLGVLSLGAVQGAVVTLAAEGGDEAEALAALAEVIEAASEGE